MSTHLFTVSEMVRRRGAVSYSMVIPVLLSILSASAALTPSADASMASSAVMAATFFARGVHPYSPIQVEPAARPLSLSDCADGEDKPIVIHSEPAVYPDTARQAGFEGTVEVLVSITSHGRVSKTEVAWSDASRLLEAAAEEAAANFIFRPACQYNLQIPCQVIVPFKFVLE
jgi:TonB family protein